MYRCKKVLYKDAFRPSRWKKAERLCKTCQDELKTEMEYECSNCHRMLLQNAFPRTGLFFESGRKCKACIQSEHETRLCHSCKRKKNIHSYHKTEWRNDEGRKCRACVNKDKGIRPTPGNWKCYGQCGGRTLPHDDFSLFREKSTGK